MSGRPSLGPHLRGTTRSSREGRPSAAYTTAVSGKNRMRRLPPDGTRNRAASAILPLDAHMFPEDSRQGRPSGVAAPVGRARFRHGYMRKLWKDARDAGPSDLASVRRMRRLVLP